MNNFLITFLSKVDGFWIGFINFFHQSQPKNGVAIIRIDAIGDFILWLDSAQHYQTIYPSQKITLIANSTWAEVADQLPFWDSVWSIDRIKFKKNILYRYYWIYKIRSANFETVVQPTHSRIFIEGDSILKASDATHRIGAQGDLNNISSTHKKMSDTWYTKLIPTKPGLMHELYRNNEFIKNLSVTDYPINIPFLQLKREQSRKQMLSPYFVIFPGASGVGKRWPLENFIKISDKLCREHSWQCIYCGSDNEIEINHQLQFKKNQYINLIGKTSLSDLVGIIKNAKLLISNDTSAIHIAMAVQTPAVCILGGGHFGRFLPYPSELVDINQVAAYHPMNCFNCDWKCSIPHSLDGPKPCVEKVDIRQVYELATRVLLNKPDHHFGKI